jgi:carboxyl-terminal processing protease
VLATAIAAQADKRPEFDKRRYQALDTFAHALSLISSRYVDPIDDSALIYGATRGMAAELDKYSAFLDPEQHRRVREDIDGEYGGVGILEVAPDIDSEFGPSLPRIESVLPDSPAARAGVQTGDRLVSVAGQPTVAATMTPGAQTSGDPDEEAGESDWLALLRGRVGTSVTVGVQRDTWNSPREFTLVRKRLKIPSVEWFAPEPGIGYVAISRFQNATAADLEHALGKLAAGDFRVLMFDLRGNPGGLVDQAIEVADMFIERGTIVSIRGRAGTQVEIFAAHPAHTLTRQRMLVLVDPGTASAAEIVAAALQDHGRATIMGLKSYGKGSVQSFFDLADGSGLKLTTAHYYSPKDRLLEHDGIGPDMQVEMFAPDVIEASSGNDFSDDQPAESMDEQAVPWLGNPATPRRLRDDHQFDVAYQTARAWLESNPSSPAGHGKEKPR